VNCADEARGVEPVLKFQAAAPNPGIWIFWLRIRLQHLEVFGSGSGTIWSKKIRKKWYYLYNQNFRLRLQHLKIFGFGHTKLLGLRIHSPGRSTEYVLLPHFNALPDVFAVMNCSVLALSSVFCSGLLIWNTDMFITATHCTITSRESACRTICTLCQQASPKRWFANVNILKFLDAPWGGAPPGWEPLVYTETFVATVMVESVLKRINVDTQAFIRGC